MSKSFKLCTECVSTVVGGKEFDLTESKRISRFKTPEGVVHSLYQDPSGEYFLHMFTPQLDQILRLNQDQASKLASVLNEDGTFSVSEEALEQAGICLDEDIDEECDGISDDLVNRLQELAEEQGMDFEDFFVQILERAAAVK